MLKILELLSRLYCEIEDKLITYYYGDKEKLF